MLFLLTVLTCFVALMLSGAIAGLFYGYSVSVMWGLDQAGGRAAIASMNGINRAILNPLFFISFMGTPVAALAAALMLYLSGSGLPAALMLAAAIVYAAGAFAPTAAVNVPMNNALADAAVGDEQAAERTWQDYSVPWTWWNHVRSMACFVTFLLAGAALFCFGLEAGAGAV